jgi:hypothetical protein
VPRQFVEIPLDKMRRLRYTVNAMVELEEMFGGGLPKIFDPETVGFKSLRALIFIGLKHAGDKRITLETTGELLTQYVLDPGKPITDPLRCAMEALHRGGFVTEEALKSFLKSLEPEGEEDEEDNGSPPALAEREDLEK